MEALSSSEMIFVNEEDEEDGKRQILHWQVLLEHLQFDDISDQVDIRFSDGKKDRMPYLVLATLSPVLKEYLNFVDTSTILEPLIVIPDLPLEDFVIFKKYLFSLSISSFLKTSDIESLKNVFDQLGIDPEFLKSDMEMSEGEEHEDHEDISPENEPQPPTPGFVSRSGRVIKKNSLNEGGNDEEEDSSLNCKYCSKFYAHAKARNKHMLAEHLEQCKEDGRIFPCSVCSAIFISKLGREKHVKRMHPLKAPIADSNDGFICPFDDNVRVDKLKDLHYHVKTCHVDKDKACLGCGQDFSSKKELEEHIQTHRMGTANSKPFFFCEHCGQVFIREYALVMHKRNIHSTMAETLHCKYCGKDFKSAKFLRHHEDKHRQGLEEKVQQHICQECGKPFPSRLNLERHLKATHHKIKEHKCNECGKQFVDSTRLKEHKWIHMDYKPFKCRFCDQTFRHKNHVKHHEAKVHEVAKEFTCDICSKSFCYAYELNAHLKSHEIREGHLEAANGAPKANNSKSNPKFWVFQCPFCTEICPTIVVLNKHIADIHAVTIQPDEIIPTNMEEHANEILVQVEDMDQGHEEEPSFVVQYVYDDKK